MPGNRIESGKKSDWALVSQPGPNQLQTTDVSTTYAGMVEGIRGLLSRFERDGMSPELEAALHQQNFRVVRCLLHLTTPSAAGWAATSFNRISSFQARCSLAILRDTHSWITKSVLVNLQDACTMCIAEFCPGCGNNGFQHDGSLHHFLIPSFMHALMLHVGYCMCIQCMCTCISWLLMHPYEQLDYRRP